MNINMVPEKIWHDTIAGKISYDFEFLALKILLARLSLNVKQDPSQSSFKKSIDELKDFFNKTQHIPTAKRDLDKILNNGGK